MQAQMESLALQSERQEAELRQARHKLDMYENGVQMDPYVARYIPKHLQQKPLQQADRKRLLKVYGHFEEGSLPKPLKDANNMAATAMGDAKDKKWVTVHAPAFQKDALDVVQVAALAMHSVADAADEAAAADIMRQALLDVLLLAGDNAQRIARVQLDRVFEAANAKGALSLIDLDGDDDLDPLNDNIIQGAHVDSIGEHRKFCKALAPDKKRTPNGQGRGGAGDKRGFKNLRGFGRRGYAKSRGGGRGGRWDRNRSAPSNRNNNNGNSSEQKADE